MKPFIILITLLTLTISIQEINLQSKPQDIIKCLLQSEILINDLNKLIEIIKEEDYLKLILKIIEIYPNAYNEIKKCLNQNVNLGLSNGCQLGSKNRCCWENANRCCRPPTRFEKCVNQRTICCKMKVYDYINKRTTIQYYEGNSYDKKEMIDK